MTHTHIEANDNQARQSYLEPLVHPEFKGEEQYQHRPVCVEDQLPSSIDGFFELVEEWLAAAAAA